MLNFKSVFGTALIVCSILGLSQLLTLAPHPKAKEQEKLATKPTPTLTPTPTPQKKGSWASILLSVFGITATSSAQKGDQDNLVGNIRIYDLIEKESTEVTKDGGYNSAIFLPCEQSIVALKDGKVLKITMPGAAAQSITPVATNPDIVKLIGFSQDDNDKILVLIRENGKNQLAGFLSLTSGKMTAIPFDKVNEGGKQMSQAEEAILNNLKGTERVYGTTKLYVDVDSREVRRVAGKEILGTDVFITKIGQREPQNISRCGGDKCGQPSLSLEGRYVVYIKFIS